MECEEFITDYSDFLDCQFEEHTLGSYCDHLLNCPDCADYDRVVRQGLELVRHLEPAESCPDFLPRVKAQVLGPYAEPFGRGERGVGALVAGLAAVALVVASSLVVLGREGAVDLPPVTVEPTTTGEPALLWGPAPRLRPTVSFLQVPDLDKSRLLATPPDQISLFRAPLEASRQPPAKGEQLAAQ
ncbi:MAG: hypothetical protein JSV86_01935 [Gemmatimonadota bacterium]|nr:MAG: hypothetical protein JSV86_01935 [Gemmatimonadota bacterium]